MDSKTAKFEHICNMSARSIRIPQQNKEKCEWILLRAVEPETADKWILPESYIYLSIYVCMIYTGYMWDYFNWMS